MDYLNVGDTVKEITIQSVEIDERERDRAHVTFVIVIESETGHTREHERTSVYVPIEPPMDSSLIPDIINQARLALAKSFSDIASILSRDASTIGKKRKK